MVPWALVKMFSNDYKMAIGLLIIWGGGQLARQIIQPKIVGDSIGIEPIPTLFLLFIGYKLSGVIGMIVAVPIGLLVYTMYQEGGFDTTLNSFKILVNGVNRFRKFDREDLEFPDEDEIRN
jgi:predicted PurR-regulated permease PerM